MKNQPADDSGNDDKGEPDVRWKRIAAVHAKQHGARDGDFVRVEGEPGLWIVAGVTVKPAPPKP